MVRSFKTSWVGHCVTFRALSEAVDSPSKVLLSSKHLYEMCLEE